MYLVVCWYDLTCFRYVFANIFLAAPKAVVMCLYNMNCCPSPCRHFPLSVLPDTFVRSKESYRVKNQTDRKQYRCKSLSLSLSVSLPSKKPTFLANSRKQKQSVTGSFSESNRNSQDKRVMQHPLKHLFFLSAPAITIHTGARIPPEAAFFTFHSFTCEAEMLNLLDQFNACAAVKKKVQKWQMFLS